MNFKYIDLFAGIGGIRMPFQEFGGECVFSSEWDKFSQITYEANFGEKPQGDITTIKESDIPSFDILTGGFPCQAFSVAGKKLGFQDTRGTLFFDIARILDFHKPKAFLLENVKGLALEPGLREAWRDIEAKYILASENMQKKNTQVFVINSFRS